MRATQTNCQLSLCQVIKKMKKWQIAILRDDIVLKPGHVICAKHFLPEQILAERLIRGLDGSVLETVRIPLNYYFAIIRVIYCYDCY